MCRAGLCFCLWSITSVLVWAESAADRAAQGPLAPIDLFVRGEGGYHTYRIPALVTSGKGTVLAFCEGRKNSPRDDGDIDLLLRRSFDGGATWQPVQLVYEEGGSAPITIGNPCPIVSADGTIHLLFSRNNQRAFYTRSTDEGATFSAPREISDSFRAFEFNAQRLGTGPVHGIQTSSSRLLAPVWLNDKIGGEYRSAVLFSDDGGSTWTAGGVVAADVKGCNECSVAELADGTLVLNMRNRQAKLRAESRSTDGAQTWSRPRMVESLIDAECQGALLGVVWHNRRMLLFSNAADPKRVRMTVRLSNDGAQTWPAARLLDPGPSAYSDLAITAEGSVLCLYECGEKGPYQRLRLVRFGIDWLRTAARPE